MRLLTFCSILICALSMAAQDWALLNPAYKYNYSNDGTDTISNQIFVTDIDTLGPDSFLYQLNRIGVVCDTCPASLGGPCDGCYIWVDQPQFLGRQVVISNGTWLVEGPMSWVIHALDDVGSTWLFDSNAVAYATVDSVLAASPFGVPDSLKYISTSAGHCIVLSRSHGMLGFSAPGGAPSFSCVGQHGAEVGSLLPKPLDFFDFPIGSALHIEDHHFWSGGVFPPLIDCSSSRVTTLLSKNQGPSSITYGLACSGLPGCAPLLPECGATSWQVTEALLLSAHPLTTSFPGQVVPITDACGQSQGFVLAEHGISSTGDRTVSGALWPADSMQLNTNCSGHTGRSTVVSNVPVIPGLHPFLEFTCGAFQYTVGQGVQEHVYSSSEYGCDVVVTFSPVGLEEAAHRAAGVWPNPASTILHVTGSSAPQIICTIFDSSGAQVLTQQVDRRATQFDISFLAPGAYVLELDARHWQERHRFVVIR